MSALLQHHKQIVMVPTRQLRHIEGYSAKRVQWLVQKIQLEQTWTKPLCIDRTHHLVMDGQHRMEAAKLMSLPYVPCLIFDYEAVSIYSLRGNYTVDHQSVITHSLRGDIYPYKTVKHRFPIEIPELSIPLSALMALELEVI